ncbi:NIPSNAP family protein [Chitinophaga sp. sic0106]|uniref:NIPSNAP family protein n=1 Tax=Chitinophaga sp. sic0106 TaxID=2854785 RepID=UPI001C450A15|nr:NIPSNAP family protein [Chitinophaga sp. sic0106]MBV7533799.1 NIPSNAP family protein [Chitinophaga sp. sic0106]
MKTLLSLLTLCITLPFLATGKGNQQYYQLKVYHISAGQEAALDSYLEQAYLPALHRAGISQVGVFKPVTQDTADLRVYVFAAFKSPEQISQLPARLDKDAAYTNAAATFMSGYNNNAPYNRIESILLLAFADMPKMALPALNSPKAERVYELRSYESATEAYHSNKVKMFNAGGEIEIFRRLGFNAVFYGSVVAGSHTPNLMYMTTFNNKADRDAHWKSFGADPAWKKLSALPEYAHNVSHQDIIFVRPTAYSDF